MAPKTVQLFPFRTHRIVGPFCEVLPLSFYFALSVYLVSFRPSNPPAALFSLLQTFVYSVALCIQTASNYFLPSETETKFYSPVRSQLSQ